MKYPGSKWGLAKWIISHFPEHHSYLEPFFGSGAILFNKPRSNIETVNDLDGDVVNLFDWIRRDIQGRERAYAARDWCSLPERILEAAERLRGVQIECMPAAELIKRFNHPNVLIYADPPYLLETRHGRQYRCEMSDEDHKELLDALLDHRGPVLLSGYDSPLYRDSLRSWHREEAVSYSQIASRKTEVLWMNFEPEGQQEKMFD